MNTNLSDIETALTDLEIHDGGDGNNADYTKAALTTDGTWQTLDLSAKLPDNAIAVGLSVRVWHANTNRWLYFRENGHTNEFNMLYVNTQVAGIWLETYGIVRLDSDYKLQYKAHNSVWGEIYIIICHTFKETT